MCSGVALLTVVKVGLKSGGNFTSLPFSLPPFPLLLFLPALSHFFPLPSPLEAAPSNTTRSPGSAVSSPSRSGAEPQPKSNLVRYSLKIWHAPILLIFSIVIDHSVCIFFTRKMLYIPNKYWAGFGHPSQPLATPMTYSASNHANSSQNARYHHPFHQCSNLSCFYCSVRWRANN